MAQALSETYRLVNYLINRFGRPDEIVVELARDMQKTKDEREKATKALKEAEERRNAYREFLKSRFPEMRVNLAVLKKFDLFLQLYYADGSPEGLESKSVIEYQAFAQNIKPKDTVKFRLWMEARRQCPYTGKPISLSDLFTGEFEIEHIYPYSLSSDDSMANKTLCDRAFNAAAGKTVKSAYIKNLGADKWVAFQQRIKCLPQKKQDRLMAQEMPEGFKDKQLTLARWAARQLRDSMKTIAHDVRTAPGGVTSILRGHLELGRLHNGAAMTNPKPAKSAMTTRKTAKTTATMP